MFVAQVPNAEEAVKVSTQLANQIGWPAVILLVILALVCYGGYRILWALAKKHMASMDKRDASFDEMSKLLPTICKAQCPSTNGDGTREMPAPRTHAKHAHG